MGQACFINAMSRGDASLIASVTYTVLIFATLYDFTVFNVVPAPLSWVGAGIIIVGALVLAWRESRLKPSSGSPT